MEGRRGREEGWRDLRKEGEGGREEEWEGGEMGRRKEDGNQKEGRKEGRKKEQSDRKEESGEGEFSTSKRWAFLHCFLCFPSPDGGRSGCRVVLPLQHLVPQKPGGPPPLPAPCETSGEREDAERVHGQRAEPLGPAGRLRAREEHPGSLTPWRERERESELNMQSTSRELSRQRANAICLL
ncbi:Neurofilament medium polypeptide, partial [Ophiophagus hannah]